MKVIALVQDPQSIARYLRHLGLPTHDPRAVHLAAELALGAKRRALARSVPAIAELSVH